MSTSIYAKLAEIQKELFVPKGQTNSFGKYNYRSCEDILKTVKPLCEKNKCVLMMTNHMIELGGRNYVEAEVTLMDTETTDFIKSCAQAREDAEKKGMDGCQITGSASSYARKYALAGLFCIDNEKDSDATNTHGKDDKRTFEESQITEDDVKKILLNISKLGVSAEDLCKKYTVKEIKELTQGQYLDVKRYLNELYEKGKK